MSKIRIGQTPEDKVVQLNLPVLAETHMFINATSGGGKSSLMRVIAERAAKHTQIIVIDWEGEYSTLREKLDLLIVGNFAGSDLPVDVRTAKLLARRLLETRVSAVIDLSELEDAHRNEYCALFFMAMINTPQELWHPVLVFVDEVQELGPQSAGGRKSEDPVMKSLQALKAMAARGRKRGFGLIAATQRITKVHKDVISTLKNQLTGQTVLDVDRDRAADNLGFNKQGSMSLRDLNPGDWFAFGPALNLKGVNLFHADQGETTHLSAGQRHTLVIPAPTDAIRKTLSQFQDLPAEVQEEQDALAAAQGEAARLRRELAQRPVNVQPQVQVVEKPFPVLNGQLPRLEAAIADLKQVSADFRQVGGQLVGVGNQVVKVGEQVEHAANEVREGLVHFRYAEKSQARHASGPNVSRHRVDVVESARVAGFARPGLSVTSGLQGRLGVGERKVLTAVAQYPGGATRAQITVLTGYKRSSRDTYIQRLSQGGYVEAHRTNIVATAEGVAALGPDFEPLPIGNALREYWLAHLTGGERAILLALANAYPQSLSRIDLEQMTGYKRSSRDTFIQRLLARRLITVQRAAVRMSDQLFDQAS